MTHIICGTKRVSFIIHARTETESVEYDVDQNGNEKYKDFNTRLVAVKKVYNVNGNIEIFLSY